MTADRIPTPGGRPAQDRVVLAAVRALVDEGRTSRLTFAEVALRADVAEDSLRRRWRTPSSLLIDALDEDAERGDYDVPVTGDLRDDLLTTGRQLIRYLGTDRGAVFLRTVIASVADPREPFTADSEVITRRLSGLQEVLVAAGETHLSVRDLVDGLIAPIYLRTALTPRARRRRVDPTPYVDKLLRIAASRAVDGVGAPR